MKKFGRKHRPFFRICATDSRAPRDGRVIEELGTYDPSIAETDARCTLNAERVQYWLNVGAQPSEKVGVLIKKYGPNGSHLDAQAAARARLDAPREIADPGEPAFKLEPEAAAAASEKEVPAEVTSKAAETETEQEAGQEEAGQEEAGQEEAGQEEAGQEEAGQEEVGQEEAGQEEAGQEEAGQEAKETREESAG
ncbi:MAG: 30S ribosomal protein S16 [Planctomycetales bacterium]|nr:30S ribosomal protein S16 [Planctomycetales bacterium]NIM09583.1 30S ribosomal protein S16 [Planctomycetales bacterium]NIN09073.1 30S ribosomal protein S16 [Planctomycetales bacterium]NIN78185.1 30S ribosomal protein S16 [Planctomycetales bacterium]NIO35372.1 30S ribosomal protein S16 [Planctomycetales bacterium]